MLEIKQSQTRQDVAAFFNLVRERTEQLASCLSAEDMVAQSMHDASPTKWHLAHTTWFFEKLILEPYTKNYRAFNKDFYHLYNSYYQSLGTPHARANRGLITRPTVSEVLAYRTEITNRMADLLEKQNPEVIARTELGAHHEMQHQELLLMDILHLFSQNPTKPIYKVGKMATVKQAPSLNFVEFEGGLKAIGGHKGFAYDCELPNHEHYLQDYELANRTVTNGEWLDFIADGGYQTASLWLSDGWEWCQQNRITAPLYWQEDNAAQFSLGGVIKLNKQAPVCNVSYYEAYAFAKYAGCRLPTEQEWEAAASQGSFKDLHKDNFKENFLESQTLTPTVAGSQKAGSYKNGGKNGDKNKDGKMLQMAGNVWEWTASPFVAYPDYKPPEEESLAEYNGKFMCSQMVMRGGSCLTPQSHIRHTYRNFFYPHMRWQMGGVRLAR